MNQNIITYLACICFIFLLGRIFIVPIKTILKLAINSVLGGILIFVINLVGSTYGFHIGLNFVTAICVGLLGIPGAILLIVLKLLVRIKKNLQLFRFWCNIIVLQKGGDANVWYCWIYRNAKSKPNIN